MVQAQSKVLLTEFQNFYYKMHTIFCIKTLFYKQQIKPALVPLFLNAEF